MKRGSWIAVSAILLTMAFTALSEEGQLSISVRASDKHSLVPFRIHLKGPDGKPVKASNLPFFSDHFTAPGSAELRLSEGEYSYEIERGPEYSIALGSITMKSAHSKQINETLKRIVNIEKHGWWPGDLHVHRPIEDMPLLMSAEDLYVAPVITWWNTKNLWTGKSLPSNTLVRTKDGRFYDVMAGEDERNGGAFMFYGCQQPMAISDAEKEYPSSITYLRNSKLDSKMWIDIEKPFWWDVPVALALGYGDSIGLANNHMCRSKMYPNEAWGKPRDMEQFPDARGNGYYSQWLYYQILNCGFRIPPSAGSASGVLPNPVGYNRVYVYLGPKLDYEKWWEGLHAGRCFVTNGPMLLVKAGGQVPGNVFKSAGALEIPLSGELVSRDPVSAIEVIVNGAVSRTISIREFQRKHSLGSLQFSESGWFLVRAIADVPYTFRFASTAPFYVEIGNQSKRVSRESTQFFLDWVRARMQKIDINDPAKLDTVLTYQRQAASFYENLLTVANAP